MSSSVKGCRCKSCETHEPAELNRDVRDSYPADSPHVGPGRTGDVEPPSALSCLDSIIRGQLFSLALLQFLQVLEGVLRRRSPGCRQRGRPVQILSSEPWRSPEFRGAFQRKIQLCENELLRTRPQYALLSCLVLHGRSLLLSSRGITVRGEGRREVQRELSR